MKKILSLLVLVCLSCMGAWADVVTSITACNDLPDHVYTIKMCKEAKYWSSLTKPVDNSSAGRFAFYKVDGKDDTYFIYSVDGNGWVNYNKVASPNNDTKNFVLSTLATSKESANYFKIIYVTGNSNSYNGNGNANGYNGFNIIPYTSADVPATDVYLNYNGGVDKNGDNTIGTWKQGNNDCGSIWVLNEQEIQPRYVTIRTKASSRGEYLYSDITKTSEGIFTYQGTLANPLTNNYVWRIMDFGTRYTNIINGEGSPLKSDNAAYSTLYPTAYGSEGWYYLRTQSATDTECINASDSHTKNNTRVLTFWNTSAGAGKDDNLWKVEDVDMTGKSVYNVVIAGDEGGGYAIYEGQRAANGGFFIASSVTDDDVTAKTIDGKEYNVSIADRTITVTYSLTYNWTGLEAIIAEANAYPYGDGLGEYSNSAFGPAKLEAEQALASRGTSIEASVEAVSEAISNLRTAINNLVLNMPQAGTFMRIHGYATNSNNYLLGTNSANGKLQLGIKDTNNGKDAIFYVVSSTTSNNITGCKIIAYTNGQYIGKKVGQVSGQNVDYAALANVGSEGVTVSFRKHAGTPAIAAYNMNVDNGGFWLAANTEADASQGWRQGDNNRIQLENVVSLPVTISAAGYATFNCPVAVEIPANVQAYTGTINGSVLKLAEVENVIPANTPVVLKGAANTYNFTISNSNAGAIASSLVGTIAAQAVTASSVVTLQKLDDVVGFYTYDGTSLRGFSAYINGSAGSNFRIAFEEITGINAIDASIAGGAIYDLTGRRVNTIQKGQIYVKNGKKFVF